LVPQTHLAFGTAPITKSLDFSGAKPARHPELPQGFLKKIKLQLRLADLALLPPS
jgi:hypothetical protein